MDGQVRVVILVGTPGSGKSTLSHALHEARKNNDASMNRFSVHDTKCDTALLPPHDGRDAMLLFAQAAARDGTRVTIANQDTLGSRPKCEAVVARALAHPAGGLVVVDRCNFDAPQRRPWIELAAHARHAPGGGARVAGVAAVWLDVPVKTCLQRVLTRSDHPTLSANDPHTATSARHTSCASRTTTTQSPRAQRAGIARESCV